MSAATNDGRSLLTGTAVYGLGEVLNRSITFLLLPLLTAYLTPDDFGISGLLTALGFLLTPVFSLGLGAAIAPLYFERDDDTHKGGVLGTTLALLLLSSSVMLTAVMASGPWISRVSFQTPEHARLVVLAAAGTAFSIVTIPFRQCLQFERRATLSVILSAASTVISVTLTIILVVALRRGVKGLVEAGLAGQAATCLLFAVPVIRQWSMRIEWKRAGQLLSLGLPLVPAFGSLFLLQHGTKYLLQNAHGIGAVGIYSLGLNVGLVVSVLVTAFQSAWIPYFMSFADRHDAARTEFGRVATFVLFGLGGISMLLFAVARPLVMIMTPPSFHEAWRIIGLSATAQTLNGLFIVLLPGVYFAQELKYITLLQSGAAAVTLGFGLVLIPPFGVSGAAYATVMGYLALVALQHGLNRIRDYVDVKYDWQRAGVFAASYIGFAAVMLTDRRWRLPQECVGAAVAAMSVPLIVWAQLTASERRTILATAKGTFRMGISPWKE